MIKNLTFFIHNEYLYNYKYFMKFWFIIIIAIFGFACTRENNIKDIRTLFEQGNYEAVQSLLERILFNNPHDVSGLMLQCELSVAQKQWNSAFVFYDSLRLAIKHEHIAVLEHICEKFLLDGVHASSVQIRRAVINTLTKLDDPSFIPLFTRGLSDSSLIVRSECARALGFIRAFSTIPILRTALTDQDQSTKLYSAATLFVMGEETETSPLLTNTFLSNNSALQYALLELVEPVRRPSILPLLKTAYGSSSPDIRLQVVEHMVHLGHQPLAFSYIEAIIQHREALPESLLAKAMDILGMFSYPPAVSLLETIASGKYPRVSLTAQLLAIRTITQNKHTFAGFSPEQFIRDQDNRIRLLGAEISYYINPAEGRKLITQLFSEKVYDIQFLCHIDDPFSLPLLKASLPDVPDDQKFAIIYYMARFRDLSGISHLLSLCRSNGEVGAYRAAGAIVQILKTFRGTKIYTGA